MYRKLLFVCSLVLLMLLFSACGSTAATSQQELPTPTPLPPAPALGLGLGLIQIMIVEGTFNLLSLQNPLFQNIRQFLPGANATALAMSFSSPMIGLEQGMLATSIGAVQAACILAGYTIGPMIVAFWLFGRRDLVR